MKTLILGSAPNANYDPGPYHSVVAANGAIADSQKVQCANRVGVISKNAVHNLDSPVNGLVTGSHLDVLLIQGEYEDRLADLVDDLFSVRHVIYLSKNIRQRMYLNYIGRRRAFLVLSRCFLIKSNRKKLFKKIKVKRRIVSSEAIFKPSTGCFSIMYADVLLGLPKPFYVAGVGGYGLGHNWDEESIFPGKNSLHQNADLALLEKWSSRINKDMFWDKGFSVISNK